MTHASLVWANLLRRPLQSLLGLACATLAFAIFGVMFGVLASFRHSSIQNAAFGQQLLTGAIVLSGVGMALILLLTAGAMAHAVRLRLYEFGVLKALGFSHIRIIALVVAEAAAPCVAGAALGLISVPVLFAQLASWLPQLATLPAPEYSLTTLALALAIAVLLPSLASVLPALRIVRLDAAAALTGSAEAPAPVRLVEIETQLRRGKGAAMPSSPVRRQLFANAGAIPGLLRQILVVTQIGFSTLPQRARSAWLITVGVGCTMFVMFWLLSMAEGIRTAILDSGDPARVLLRAGSTVWLNDSQLPEGVTAIATSAPGVALAEDGSPMVGAVLRGGVWPLVRRSNGKPAVIEIVGVGPHWREMTPSFRLLSGRLPTPGTHEVMVGRLAVRAVLGLDGGPVKTKLEVNGRVSRDLEWRVVGTYATGDWWDGYVVGDIAVLRHYSGGLSATDVQVRLDSPQSFDVFRGEVTRQLPPSVKVERETDYYASFWRALPKNVLFIAYVLGGLLAAGAIMATMQVTHGALEARRREIATLRILGFDGRAAAASIMLETVPFAALGAWIGAGLVWLLRDGDLWIGAGSVFEAKVDLHLMLVATCCAVTIAMIGTLPLTIRSLRRGEMDGLKDLREIEESVVTVHKSGPEIWHPDISLGLANYS